MAYVPEYTEDDIAPIVVDVGSKVLVQVGVFAAIIGILFAFGIGALVYRWAMKKKR